MPRQDGRIEQGQSLKSAISARAWNRAQDAADIVLGQRYGLRAVDRLPSGPAALVVPCLVSTTVANVMPGHVVRFASAAAYVVPNNNDRVPSVFALSGTIALPVQLNSYPATKEPFGVILGGTTMPRPGVPQVAMVCVSGLCVARVRYRTENSVSVGPYMRISLAASRPGDDADLLAGAAEASSCGPHRLVAYLGAANNVVEYAAVIL